MADPVSRNADVGVGGILTVVDAVGGGVVPQHVTGGFEEGAHQLKPRIGRRRRTGAHAAQTRSAGAAEQAQQEKFGLVPGVVGERDSLRLVGGGGPGEKRVAETAGNHLGRFAGLVRRFPDRQPFAGERKRVLPGQIRHKRGFRFGFTAQAVVCVGDHQRDAGGGAKLGKNPQQYD